MLVWGRGNPLQECLSIKKLNMYFLYVCLKFYRKKSFFLQRLGYLNVIKVLYHTGKRWKSIKCTFLCSLLSITIVLIKSFKYLKFAISLLSISMHLYWWSMYISQAFIYIIRSSHIYRNCFHFAYMMTSSLYNLHVWWFHCCFSIVWFDKYLFERISICTYK